MWSSDIEARGISNVLTISSYKKRATEDDTMDQSEEFNENFMLKYECELLLLSEFNSNAKEDVGIVHIANEIELRIKNCHQVYCDLCIQVLHDNKKVRDDICIGFGKCKPCVSTFQLCKLSDTTMKHLIDTGPGFKNKVYYAILKTILWKNIFPEWIEEHDEDHKHFLIKYIVDEYINIKCSFIAKQKTISLQKKYLRNRLKKLIHHYRQ